MTEVFESKSILEEKQFLNFFIYLENDNTLPSTGNVYSVRFISLEMYDI